MKTKFEQHTRRGKAIANDVRFIMDKIYEKAQKLKYGIFCLGLGVYLGFLSVVSL